MQTAQIIYICRARDASTDYYWTKHADLADAPGPAWIRVPSRPWDGAGTKHARARAKGRFRTDKERVAADQARNSGKYKNPKGGGW